ncbi:WSC domain-containing protein [Aspergillus ambiguus]|uniref:WSC domain-containing protein n=1 Tax=Aspergillus ambiguus TaxID=176160 RepID=UPI003CCD0F85
MYPTLPSQLPYSSGNYLTAKMKYSLTTLIALALSFSASATASRKYVGCYSSAGSLENEGGYKFQSPGYCLKVCNYVEKPVMAMTDGTNCYCGDEMPSSDASVSDSECNVPCAGWPDDMCGGKHAWSVYTNDSGNEGSSNSNSNSTTTPSTVTTSTSGSVSVSSTTLASGTPRANDASTSSSSASPTTSTSGANRRYGYFW